jgi:hypothetical protein
METSLPGCAHRRRVSVPQLVEIRARSTTELKRKKLQ